VAEPVLHLLQDDEQAGCVTSGHGQRSGHGIGLLGRQRRRIRFGGSS
jgi:hypothetical protein